MILKDSGTVYINQKVLWSQFTLLTTTLLCNHISLIYKIIESKSKVGNLLTGPPKGTSVWQAIYTDGWATDSGGKPYQVGGKPEYLEKIN